MRTNATFNVLETRSDMGVFTELVRSMPNACRSLHPTHPIVAIGPMAPQLTRGHHEHAYALGMGTPFFKMVEAGGKILMIGVDLNSLTAFHIYEDLIVPISWWDVYEDIPRTFNLIDRDYKQLVYKGYFHSLEGARAREVEHMRPAFEKHAGLRRIRTDFSHLDVMDLRGVVNACLRELLAGCSAYGPVQLTPDEQDRASRALELLSS
jgi:aminoglycoside 3-N-acetyltransferase